MKEFVSPTSDTKKEFAPPTGNTKNERTCVAQRWYKKWKNLYRQPVIQKRKNLYHQSVIQKKEELVAPTGDTKNETFVSPIQLISFIKIPSLGIVNDYPVVVNVRGKQATCVCGEQRNPYYLYCTAQEPRVASLRPQQALDCPCDVFACGSNSSETLKESTEVAHATETTMPPWQKSEQKKTYVSV